jgi:HD-GYP domain-containing protein (c-di-GMP phosphodiesterase class II)
MGTASAWEEAVACEPRPHTLLEGGSIDRALAAIGDFADLVSPYFVGHSAGVARLAMNAAQRCSFDIADVTVIRRAAFIHDIGRVTVPARVWASRGR